VNHTLVLILAASVLILILIPVVMMARLAVGIAKGVKDERARQARRLSRVLPGLGEFSTTDGAIWDGQAGGVHITLDCPDGPPDEGFAAFVRTLLEALPTLTNRTRKFLIAQDDAKGLTDVAGQFEVSGMECSAGEASFVLQFTHPQDPDGVYRVLCNAEALRYLGRDD
jgi:hypothetical protein